MVLDIAVAAVLGLTMMRGGRRGALYIFMRTLGLPAGIVTAFFLSPSLSDVMYGGWVGKYISRSLSRKFEASFDAVERACDSLPEIIGGGIGSFGEGATDILVNMLTGMIVSLISFITIVIAVWFVINKFTRAAARRRRSTGIAAMVDRIFGFALGALIGLFIIYLMLALLLLFVNLAEAKTAEAVLEQLNGSVAAGSLYNNNILLLMTEGLF